MDGRPAPGVVGVVLRSFGLVVLMGLGWGVGLIAFALVHFAVAGDASPSDAAEVIGYVVSAMGMTVGLTLGLRLLR